MELSQFLDTLRAEISNKSEELTPGEYSEWLEEQVRSWDKALQSGRVKHTNKIKKRFEAVRDFYAAAKYKAEL